MTVATGGVLNAAVRPELELPLSIFTPLAMFATDPQVVAVRAESKFQTFKELIEAAKREPGTIAVGITGGEREPGASRSTSSNARPARNSDT